MLAAHRPADLPSYAEVEARLARAIVLQGELQQMEEGRDPNGRILAAAKERLQNSQNRIDECHAARADIAVAKAQNAAAKAENAEALAKAQATQAKIAALKAQALAKKASKAS